MNLSTQEKPASLWEKIADVTGINTWFTRPAHRVRTQFNPVTDAPPDAFISPCEAKVETVHPIGPDGVLADKAVLAQPRLVALADILKDGAPVEPFLGGTCIKLYLAPYDLHYILFPVAATVRSVTYSPGKILPIFICKQGDVENERLTFFLEAEAGFPLVVSLVGSLNVNGIVRDSEIGGKYPRGARLGRFKIGSTVILAVPPGKVAITCKAGQKVRLGEVLGSVISDK